MTKRRKESDSPSALDLVPDDGVVVGGEGNGQGVARVPEGKGAKWQRLIQRRMAVALKALFMVERLANRSSYDYSTEHAARVISDLSAAVDRVVDAYTAPKRKVLSWSLTGSGGQP